MIERAFAGKGNADARQTLLKAVGQEAADAAAKRFGLASATDFRTATPVPQNSSTSIVICALTSDITRNETDVPLEVDFCSLFSPSFFMNVKLAYYGKGFSLSPRGDTSGSVDLEHQVTTGASLFYGTKRPQYTGNIDANYFFAGMGGNNELKFGFGYRKTPVSSSSEVFIPGKDFELLPQGRPADLLRLIPGFVISQHQGGGIPDPEN